jgi:hypothetical protein
MKKTAGNNKTTKTVTIISLWTRHFQGPAVPHQYDVTVPVAPTVKAMLESAYARTNDDNFLRPSKVWATTAGDLMVLDGTHYLVASSGFLLLTSDEVAQEITVADSLESKEWATRCMMSGHQPSVLTCQLNLRKFKEKL